ncbi:MAG: ComEC/Rec2 family competence protein [Candidatus Yanofskybacteria bacterium]|nr:ComEC/Rec2 family competence protein [Candidatus Yanofskybacteria bacterium]
MTRGSQLVFAVCLSFGAGIIAGELLRFDLFFFLIPGIVCLAASRRSFLFLLCGIILFSFSLGIWRSTQESARMHESKLVAAAQHGGEFSFEGIITEEPEPRGDSQQLVIEPVFLKGERILVRAASFPEFRYGDRISFQGTIQVPESFRDFDWRLFLAKERIYAQSQYPFLDRVSENQGSALLFGIFSLKEKLRKTIDKLVPEPESSVLAAMILGDKGRMSKELGDVLSRSGLRHITAISGMHVAITGSLILSFLLFLGMWRQHAFFLSLAVLFFFIALTGFQISAVRAGIMGGMYLVSRHTGRMGNSLRALLFTGAGLLFWNPLLLLHDAGFQLSFLAVLGIILFLSEIQRYLGWMPEAFGMREVLGMSIAAQIFTFPLLLLVFDYASAVALLSNILVVPLLPFILSLGFAFLLLGFLFAPLAFVFGYVEFFLLSWITGVAAFFAKFPVIPVSAPLLFLVFLLEFMLVYALWKREKVASPWGPKPAGSSLHHLK